MDTTDNNVTTNNINEIENGVDSSSDCNEKRMSGTSNSNEYRPLNSFDTDDINERSRQTVLGINRKALLSFSVVAFVALTIIVLTVVFVVQNGMFYSFIL